MPTNIDNTKQHSYQTWMTVVFDKSLMIVDIINPQHCMLLQLNEDIIIGKSVTDLECSTNKSNKQSAITIAKNVRKAYAENRNVYFEYTTTHKDNSITYSVCYAEKGADELLYVNVIKIDEENIFEAREGFTNYIIDVTINNISVGVGMRHISENGEKKYILFNDVAKEFFECDDVLQSKYWNQEEDDLADSQAMQLRDPLKIEKVIRDEHGEIRRWLVLTKKKIDSRASGHYIVTTIIDITKRRQNEILLEQQFSLLDTMYKNLPVGIIIYDKTGRLISVNQKNRDIMGLTPDADVTGINLFDEPHVPEDLKARLKAGKNIAYDLDYNFEAIKEYFPTTASGIKPLHINISVIKSNNSIDGYLLVNQDRSTFVERERLLEQTAAKLASVFNSMSSGIEIYNTDGVLVDCNDFDLKIFGIDHKENFINSNITLYNNPNLSPEDAERLKSGNEVNIHISYDFDVVKKHNYYSTTRKGRIYLEVKGSPMYTPSKELVGYVIEMNDVTRIKEQEMELMESHKNLALALTAGKVSAWKYDIRSRHFSTILGNTLAGDGLSYEDNEKLLHPDDCGILRQMFDNLISGKTEGGELTLRYYDNQYCDYKYYESQMDVRRGASGNIEYIIGTQRDITEKCLKKLELDNARKSLNLVMEASNILAWDYDILTDKYRILYGSRLLDKHSGITHDRSNVHPEDRKNYDKLIQRVITGQTEQDVMDVRIKDNDGIYYYYEHTVSAVKNNDGKVIGLIGSMFDVTERRQKRLEIEKAQRDLEIAIESGNMSSWSYDVKSRVCSLIYGNSVIGNGNGILTYERCRDMLPAEDVAEFTNTYNATISGAQQTGTFVIRFRNPHSK